MGPEYFWGSGVWFFPIIMPVIMIIMVIVVCLILGRGGFRLPCCSMMADRHHGSGSETESASEILNKRYVRGEITKDEFERMKRDIQG